MRARRQLAVALGGLLAAVAIGCGGDDKEAAPLDEAAAVAAVAANVDATHFCTPDQLALAPDESVSCPAVARTGEGPVKGNLVLTREGDAEQLTYELSLSGASGGSKISAGSFSLDDTEAEGDSQASGGSALERALSEKLDGAEVSCDSAKAPTGSAAITCTASGEDEDGEAFEGKVTVKRSAEAGAIGSEYSYEATLQKEGGGTRFAAGVFGLD